MIKTKLANIEHKLKEIINKIRRDKEVIAIFLYGSYLRNREYARDIDLCVMVDNKGYSISSLGKKRLSYLISVPEHFDIQVFQLLPLYVRIKVLKEGKILYSRNQRMIYDIAYDTIKEYRLFEPHYLDYIEVNKL